MTTVASHDECTQTTLPPANDAAVVIHTPPPKRQRLRLTPQRPRPLSKPKDRPLDADVVSSVVTWVLEKYVFDADKLRDMRRQINTRLVEYTGSDTQLLSLNNDVKGAHLRMTSWILNWQPSRPKLMKLILARLRNGRCDPLAPAVVVEGPDRFRLVLKIAIRDMLKEDGARLVAEGELEDVDSVATKKSLERLGAVLLGVLVARARAGASACGKVAFVELCNSNDYVADKDARGAAIVFNANAREWLEHAIYFAMGRCAVLMEEAAAAAK